MSHDIPKSVTTISKDSLAVREVIQRPTLINDPNSRLLRPDPHTLDILTRLPQRLQLRKHLVRGIHRRLRVELGRVGDLEQHVLHHV